MSFLQPWLLVALPVAALPIIIHLIHQRRFQSIEWGAMRFLMEAHRMSRGYARLRQWLILLMRVIAIAALILLISRPLATGWLGVAGGGRPDTTLILLDRSASMLQQDAGAITSKLNTGAIQLASTLSTLGSGHWVLIDSVSNHPTDLTSPAELPQSPLAQPASASADLPAMLQSAYDYISNNRAGQTEIWICSDLRANDWNAESGRWKALRDSFEKLKQSVRFHLLAYSATPTSNVAVRITNVERRVTGDSAALFLTVQLTRQGGDGKLSVPMQFDVEGARSELTVEMDGREFELKNHSIPLAANHVRGWGRVTIPADQNPADNEFYFSFDAPPPRRTIIVAENRDQVRPLELAAASSPDPAIKSEVEVVTTDQLASLPWEQAALLLWQAPLPSGETSDPIRKFVDRGGQVIFFPPREVTDEKIFKTRWSGWETPPEAIRVETWRGDQDLLARTQSGAALPVGELAVRRYCKLVGETVPVATLYGGAPLLARVATDRGGVYFCSTTPAANDSSLGTNGVALYVVIQRALAAGAAQLSQTKQLSAGDAFPKSKSNVRPLAGIENSLSTEYPFQAGVYQADDNLLAVNREQAEDRATVLSENRVAELFRGLDFDRVDDQAGNMTSLAREVWRVCIGAMMIAIVAEAGLCLPRSRRQRESAA
jgi:hypothetical protein